MTNPMIMDGRTLAKSFAEKFKTEVSRLAESGVKPCLSVVMVGENPASKVFVRNKVRFCNRVGVKVSVLTKPASISESELLELIDLLNEDENVHGILVQLPLPGHIDPFKVMARIDPIKDVDGLTPVNLGRLAYGDEALAPCGAKAVMRLLERYGVDLEGQDVCIISNSVLVGKPLSVMMTNRFATVSLCHIKTRVLKDYTSRADVLISATGVPHLVKADMVKRGAVVVDVGISRLKGRIVGDVDFENVKELVSMITPVPGGVGPMTVAMVVENLLNALRLQRGG